MDGSRKSLCHLPRRMPRAYIMLEEDATKRLQMYDAMLTKIARHKVPIRKGRKFPVRFKTDNNNSINKLKSY